MKRVNIDISTTVMRELMNFEGSIDPLLIRTENSEKREIRFRFRNRFPLIRQKLTNE